MTPRRGAKGKPAGFKTDAKTFVSNLEKHRDDLELRDERAHEVTVPPETLRIVFTV